MRSSSEVEDELALLIARPPALDVAEVGRWLAKLQSLLSEVRRAQVREARKRV